MSAINFLNTFFENNKDTICIPKEKVGIYNINQEKVQEYITSNCIKELHPLLHFIFNNIQYIDFNQFYSSLEKYIMEINKVHRNGNNEMVIKAHLIIPKFFSSFRGIIESWDSLYKSNFWISLLIKKIIIDNDIKNFEIVNIVDDIYDFAHYELDESHIGIFPDDCAYSGQQSGDHLFHERLPSNNKVYVLIPYISNYAYAMYKIKARIVYGENYPANIIFLENCIHFIESLPELCIKNNFNIFKNDVFYLNEENYNNMTNGEEYIINTFIQSILLLPECGVLIYFDHKVADQASTIQYFLNYSTILNNVYIATNITIDSDTHFNEYSNNYHKALKNYFTKPINIFSDDLKTSYTPNLSQVIRYFFGKEYIRRYYNKMKDHKKFVKRNCETNIIYYSVINNCENKPFYNLPEEDMITLLDLNKKKDKDGNNYSCPTTFYKQSNFYKFSMAGGKYYTKYINAKTKYLKLKKN